MLIQKWFYNNNVDTDSDRWLPVISTQKVVEVQGDPGDIVCAFDPDYKPDNDTIRLMLAAPEMLKMLKRINAGEPVGEDEVTYLIKVVEGA